MEVGARVGSTRLGALLLAGATVMLFAATVASAAPVTKEEALFRIDSSASNIATDPLTGHILVSGDNRIDEYTPWGDFVRAFGTDVAPGAVNETQEVRVRAGAGAFKLAFGASTTADLPFNATAAQVQSALNALASIGGAGGSVSVTSLPGKAVTATPYVYVVVFKGSLAATDVAQLTAANGATPLSEGNPKTELEVRMRADGTPGGTGLESCTAESGCQKGAARGAGGQLSPGSLAVGPGENIYVGEGTRIQELSPSGHFLRLWGGDVIRDGAKGSGVLTPGSTLIVSAAASQGVFKVQQPIEGTGIEPGTKIAALGAGTITLSQPAGPAATGEATAIVTPPGANDVPSNEIQTISLGSNTTGGTFGLTFSTPKPSNGKVGAGNALVYRNAEINNFTVEKGDSFVTATTTSGSPTVTAVSSAITGDLTAGSTKVANVNPTAGNRNLLERNASFGDVVTGTGIPPGTTLVLGASEEELELSAPATGSGTGVALSFTAKGKADTTSGSKEITITTAVGNATLTTGSKIITGIARSSGFRSGQEISGPGIPAATGTGTITAGSNTITSVSGSFKVGETLFGPGIQGGTRIQAVEPGKLTLSETLEATGSGVPLKAVTTYSFRQEGEVELSSPAEASGVMAVRAGAAKVGDSISGPGIPVGTTITAVAGRTATLSAPTTATASEAPVSFVRRPFFVSPGEAVSGPGIPAGATVESVAPNGDLTLSANATASAKGAPLKLGIAYNASAATLQSILAAMPSIGAGNVAVSGPSGGPWTVEFKGPRLANTDVETLIVDGAALTVSSGQGEATVSSENAEEICEAAAECQLGAGGVGPGQSRGLRDLAFSPDNGTLYAMEEGRIQKFSPGGAYLGTLPDPSQVFTGKTITALAVSPNSGDLYVDFGLNSKGIYELDPTSGVLVRKLEIAQPGDLATSPAGELYAIKRRVSSPVATAYPHVVAFNAAGNQVAPPVAEEESCLAGKASDVKAFCEEALGIQAGRDEGAAFSPEFNGLGISAVGDLYVSTSNGPVEHHIQAYGPPPLRFESPPLVPPTIEDTYAISVDTSGANLGAKINPHFFSGALGETRYYVQYGTAACVEPSPGEFEWAAPCVEDSAVPPGPRLRSGPVSTGVAVTAFFSELEPGTEYRYRFVAESSAVPGQAVYGPSASFATAPLSAQLPECPKNQSFRGGASEALPDCRAYEMVSPVEKQGGDIAVLASVTSGLPATIDMSAPSGEKFAYGTYKSFGAAESAPYTSEYVAARGAEGWDSHGVSPPRTESLGGALAQTYPEFSAFSPDLCQAWINTLAEPPLAPGAVAGSFNLYRRGDEECGGQGFVALTAPEADLGEADLEFDSELEGISADGSKAFLMINAPLTADAPSLTGVNPQLTNSGGAQLYEHSDAGLSFVCILPGARAAKTQCAAGYNNNSLLQGFSAEVHNAVSADGERVFWTTTLGSVGFTAPIYLRQHPDRPQSALVHGSAIGTGSLTQGSTTIGSLVAARGKVSTVEKSPVVALLEAPSVGEFVSGQPLNTTSGIEAGTTIVSCSPQCGPAAKTLTLSKNATATKASVTLTSKGPMPFAVGQTITAPGIPLGTTITAVKAGELTISKAATASGSGVSLDTFSPCSEAAKACTIDVSEAAEAQSGSKGSHYWTASPDGSLAIFSTGDDNSNSKDLYEAAIEEDAEAHLSTQTDLIAHKVLGKLGASEDARRVYFASEEVLTAGPNAEGKSPTAGKPNLYLYDAEKSGAGRFAFIGTLADADTRSGSGSSATTALSTNPGGQAARVSPDGRHAVFDSWAPLTGYDNRDIASGERDTEVFLYDASASEGEGKLLCVSCNPSGTRPAGINNLGKAASTGSNFWAAAMIPGAWNQLSIPRPLSENGNRLFFDSADPLLHRDTNGTEDVYEWEAPGEDSCTEEDAFYRPRNGGCIYLISSGTSPEGSVFLDADPEGENVFFTTLESLLSQDPGLVDVYDARVGGGLPPPPTPAAQCEGEACQGTPEAPNDPTPASSSFEGAGNVREEPQPSAPKPCAKGKVRRHGKCVAKHAKKPHKRAKRHRRAGR